MYETSAEWPLIDTYICEKTRIFLSLASMSRTEKKYKVEFGKSMDLSLRGAIRIKSVVSERM